MTKINPEDISCFSNDEELLDDVDLDIQIHCSSEAQLYKQSILQNQEIVERLRKEIEDIEFDIIKTKGEIRGIGGSLIENDANKHLNNLYEYSAKLNSILKTPTEKE
ncbi:hypothetical protein [Nitrososphaeria virus YSH_922147]|uniref:Uncharacterized protein n=1 Tax=Nitrososphaeria virus YSH_922147 TaxID=3071323 RepID=A0A976YF13_9CAUD|nr:hypothetical protein QKV94_gp16 [Yangshan Harbor Nitrososphaeria virus]UVF62425.1 hypothetical protein [Nitrososphaeria virus YSH_922147]